MEIIHVHKRFGDEIIFQDFSLHLPEGEFIAFMGPSGRGKTTLFRMILGLEPYEGEIIAPKSAAAVFQESVFLDHLSLRKNLELVGVTKKIEELATELGLLEALDKPVGDFSGGMRRRASILRLLLLEKELYILDEPFKELDRENYENTMALVREILQGKTVLFSTHRQSEAEFFKSKIVSL